MLIIRLVMVHMGPKHTQYGQKTARLAPVLQNGLKGHVGALRWCGAPCHPQEGCQLWHSVRRQIPTIHT